MTIPQSPLSSRARKPAQRGMTLVEVLVAMLLLSMGLLAFLGTFIQSRRVTEGSVLHAAASSLVYGLIEQIKGLDYTSVPSGSPSEIRLRVTPEINVDSDSDGVPDGIVALRVVYTQAPDTPAAPLTTPSIDATADSLDAIDNIIGPLPLSSTAGTQSQKLTINLWIWVDEIPLTERDVKDVKKVTIVYTYQFNDGIRTRTIRDREVLLRTRFDQ